MGRRGTTSPGEWEVVSLSNFPGEKGTKLL